MRYVVALVSVVFLQLLVGSGATHNTPLSVRMPDGGTVTSMQSLEDYLRLRNSSGIFSGFDVSVNEAAGTATVTSGEAILRETDSPTAAFHIVSIAGATFEIPDGTTRYVVADYNGGSPQLALVDDLTAIPCQAKCVIVVVTHAHGSVHWLSIGTYANDFQAKTARRLAVTSWLDHAFGGVVSDEGTLHFSVSAGGYYIVNNLMLTTAFDSSGSDRYVSIYRDGAGGWTNDVNQSTVDNEHYDDGSGTLAEIQANKYAVRWVYQVVNNPSEVFLLLGQSDYVAVAGALAESVPTMRPPSAQQYGVAKLIAKIIVQQGNSEIYQIQGRFTEKISWE